MIHKSTRQTPFKLLFGREARTPFSAVNGQSLSTHNLETYQAELIKTVEDGMQAAKKMMVKAQEEQKMTLIRIRERWNLRKVTRCGCIHHM